MKDTNQELKRGKKGMNKIAIIIVMTMLLFGSIVIAEEMDGGGGKTTDPIKLIIEPDIQNMEGGKATYKIQLIETEAFPKEERAYYFNIKFEADEGVEGKFHVNDGRYFSEDGFDIIRGSRTIYLDVETQLKTTDSLPFTVTVTEKFNENIRGSVEGVFYNGDKLKATEIISDEEKPIFEGEGFVIRPDPYYPGTGDGTIFYITLFRNGDYLSGTYIMRPEPDRKMFIKGEISGNKITFRVSDEQGYQGDYEGVIEEYQEVYPYKFGILRGNVYYTGEGREHVLIGPFTAIDRKDSVKISVGEEFSVGVPVSSDDNELPDSVNPVPDKSDELETTVTATVSAIKSSKILGIIPKFWSDDKLVVVEFKEGGKISTVTINEHTSKDVGNYIIEVGEVEDESNIEISVSRKS